MKDGLTSQCKECINLKHQKYYTENKEKFAYNQNRPESQKAKKKITDAAYRERHRDKELLRHKIYDESHREEKRARGRLNYHKNKDRYAEYSRNYRKTHPEWHNRYQMNRRLRIIENGGIISEQEWVDLCNRYGNICLCCKKKKKLTLDHVIPITKGGPNTVDNTQPLCKTCNSSKGTKIIDYRNLEN